MKKILLILLILAAVTLAAFGCASTGNNEFNETVSSGEIGSFSAITPNNNVTLRTIPVFSWSAAQNADSYTLEIASSDEFDIKDELYIKKSGISTTTFNLVADLKKNQTYYWRVTARNSTHAALIDGGALSFFYEATLYDVIPLSIGYADEWKVHEVGSKATVQLDKTNFFRNDKESLRISFDKEDTQRGEEYVESNGWVVVTKSLEQEFYGVDAFYFNFYYAGNDATAFFRVIDEDNEYWYAPIKLASNAKQTIIIRFDEFILRTKGTPVMNERFDYNYLKSVELVFERVDGDGVAYFSDLRAVRYDSYRDMFIDQVDFSALTPTFEAYNFGLTVGDEGKSLTYSFSGQPNEQNARGIQGYGFIKYPIGKLLTKGDAFEFTLDFTTPENFRNANVLIRVIEEDSDRWIFKQRVSEVPDDGKIILPYSAFTLNEFKGDGIRQFYYVKELQFGINENYSGGAIKVSDFKVCSLAEKFPEDLYKTEVGADGVIENFESYANGVEAYYKWEASTANKDEAISLYAETELGAGNTAAKFGYKTDLPAASYQILLKEAVEGFTALEISARDMSIENADATMILYLGGDAGEIYSYTIEHLADDWKKYVIPFSEFSLTEDSVGMDSITCERIVGIGISLQYFFPKTSLFSDPAKYVSGSVVALDDIRFSTETTKQEKDISSKIKPSATDNKIAVISDFDEDTAESLRWVARTTADYATLDLSTDTATGEGKSLSVGYKTQKEAIYYITLSVDSSVSANGISLKMKGDSYNSKATLVLYFNIENKPRKYQLDLSNISAEWKTYSAGFSAFSQTEGDSHTLVAADAKNLTQILFNFKNWNAGGEYASHILLDDLVLDGKIALDENTNAQPTPPANTAVVTPSASDSKVAVVSDFDTDTVESLKWQARTTASYATLALSDTTASGAGKSLAMGYKTGMESIYYIDVAVDQSVQANGISFLLKGDNYNSQATVVLYFGSSKYQATISGLSEGWNVYSIGFSAFSQSEGATHALTAADAKNLTQIMVNYKNWSAGGYYASTMLLDYVVLDGNIALDANTKTAYGN